MSVLTAVDVLKVQEYVFSSNRLRDVVSASWNVHWATTKDGALRNYQGQVLCAAGGNAVLEFADMPEARSFAARYTSALLEETPGLEVIIKHRFFRKGELAAALLALQKDLALAKLERVPSVKQLGLSVTASCSITGSPASFIDKYENMPVSRKVALWRSDETLKKAEERWYPFLPNTEVNWRFPADIEYMGRTPGKKSMMGVVHLDGNGVGKKIKKWLKDCLVNKVPDEKVRDYYCEWSSALEELMHNTFRKIVTILFCSIDASKHKLLSTISELELELHENNLPIRPVLLGGDDLTFLCDARVALDLAAGAMEFMEQTNLPHLGKVTACAGVAFVHIRFPFSHAYTIAEKLCRSAKDGRREKDDQGSWLDWHVGLVKPEDAIVATRKRDYVVNNSSSSIATCRPYPLGFGSGDLQKSWLWLAEKLLGVGKLGLRGEIWGCRRNKVKSLMSLALQGPEQVKKSMEAWRVIDSELSFADGLGLTGYFPDNRSPLIDAVELLDIYYPIKGTGTTCTSKTEEVQS